MRRTKLQTALLDEVTAVAAKAEKAGEPAICRALLVVVLAYEVGAQRVLADSMLPLLTDLQTAQQRMETIRARKSRGELP